MRTPTEVIAKARKRDPGMPAIELAKLAGVQRERVRQILIELGLPTRVSVAAWRSRARRANGVKPKRTNGEQTLLQEVEAYLVATGMTSTQFGIEAGLTSMAVPRLRAGVVPTEDTEKLIRRQLRKG
jgi:hypothetical protein